ncbi:MAG: hypothetical protein N3D11_06285 [Candidatus Sumerlaeia bacterium]|nr:hypothetical protein [Candidatus Sumerlaeia bacterium]
MKLKIQDETYYECAKCKARAPIRRLRDSATTYWQGRSWKVEHDGTHAGPKDIESVSVRYPARLDAKEHRYAKPYCSLTGECTELGPTGLVFSAVDFKRHYFEGMSTDYRVATIQFTEGAYRLPPILRGSIIQITFSEATLPKADIRVAFQGLTDEEQNRIIVHIESLRGRMTQWSVSPEF